MTDWKGKVIMYVGRLDEEQKNLYKLIDAVALVKHECWLAFIGCSDAERAEEYRYYADNHGVSLTTIPPVPREELPGLYNEADVFCLVTHWEGMPKVLLEAMSCECVCMVSEMADEWLDMDRSGWDIDDVVVRCDHNDAKDIAEKLRWIFNNPEEAERIAKNARKMMIDRFDSEKLIEKEMELLETVAMG